MRFNLLKGGDFVVFVVKSKGDTKESLFRKFTRAFLEENIIDELRKKMFYKKPSLVRKEQARERLKRAKKTRKG